MAELLHDAAEVYTRRARLIAFARDCMAHGSPEDLADEVLLTAYTRPTLRGSALFTGLKRRAINQRRDALRRLELLEQYPPAPAPIPQHAVESHLDIERLLNHPTLTPGQRDALRAFLADDDTAARSRMTRARAIERLRAVVTTGVTLPPAGGFASASASPQRHAHDGPDNAEADMGGGWVTVGGGVPIRWDTEGKTIEGTFLGKKPGRVLERGGTSILARIGVDGKEILVPCTTQLADKLDRIQIGDEVSIKYLGIAQPSRPGGNSYKDFEVKHRPRAAGSFPRMAPPQTPTAPSPPPTAGPLPTSDEVNALKEKLFAKYGVAGGLQVLGEVERQGGDLIAGLTRALHG